MAEHSVAEVYLWGEQIGAVAWDSNRQYATFAYTDKFARTGLQPSPLLMPTDGGRKKRFTFTNLNRDTFAGLPGMLADSLPDRFGNAMIDVWLAKEGRTNINPVEKLLYMGSRGMGALEFRPAIRSATSRAVPIDMPGIIELANQVMQAKGELQVSSNDNDALNAILQIGTSAGGARPKGIVAINSKTKEIISGQAAIPIGFDHWIIKFDGITDMELGEPKQFGRIEFAYYLMAKASGIDMIECDLWEESGRAHFMTRRFDRANGGKIHMQSLCALAHYDFNRARAYSYSQALLATMRITKLQKDIEELYRRMVFNVLARNQDDHTKNISYLMDQTGAWMLSPAYDLTYAHNPAGQWTNEHQMLVNGKSSGFTRKDLQVVGDEFHIRHSVIEKVETAVNNWPEYARLAGLNEDIVREIGNNHRTRLLE